MSINPTGEIDIDKWKSMNKISFISPSPFDASYESNFKKRTTNEYASILTGKSNVFGEYEKIIQKYEGDIWAHIRTE